MKKIKPIIQSSLKDCGICSMAWIIEYYDGYVPLEKLRDETLTDLNGTSAFHIVTAFQKLGFDSKGIMEKDINSNKIFLPLIAHLQLENGLEHFVVVNKIHNQTLYIMDPGVGYVKMAIDKFNILFTGNIILAYPRSNILNMQKGISIKELFYNIVVKEKFLIIKIIITSIIWTILLIISSYYLKIGSTLINNDINLFKYFILIFGVFTFLKVIFLYIRNYYINHLSNLVDVRIYPEFLRHLFSLPLKSIKNRTSGEIMTRIEELASIKNLFSDIFVSGFLDSLMILLSIFVLYMISSKLFICLFIFIVIYIILGIITSKITYQKVLKNINYQTDFNVTSLEHINMFESIKNLNIVDKVLNSIEYVLAKLLLNNYKFNEFFNITNLTKDFILEISLFIINTYGFYLIQNNNLSFVDLFTFNIIISYFIEPIKNIINILPKYNYIKASFSKIQEFININEEKIEENNISLKGNIEFNNIDYSYNNYDYIIKDCSFVINEKEHVLLNGPSGTGKSTICRLLYGENICSKGNIKIGNKNIKDINIYTIRNNILYVSQNEKLFTGSIKDNIKIYRDIDDDKFNEICKLCEVDKIVDKKGMRYDSLIEPTSNLSGGEKQRIILARGLLKDANIIILDEALSEVDSDLETKIIKNIRKYFKDKTIIYISHKNQTNNFEKIIDMGEVNGIL